MSLQMRCGDGVPFELRFRDLNSTNGSFLYRSGLSVPSIPAGNPEDVGSAGKGVEGGEGGQENGSRNGSSLLAKYSKVLDIENKYNRALIYSELWSGISNRWW